MKDLMALRYSMLSQAVWERPGSMGRTTWRKEKEQEIAMAIRQIRTIGDEILRKECKPVKLMTPRTQDLIEDMFETMYEENGVGLAAPQVGVLKQIVVIDVEDGEQYVLINPKIVETEGSVTGYEEIGRAHV